MEGVNAAFFKMKPTKLNKSQAKAIKKVVEQAFYGRTDEVSVIIDSIAEKGYFARVDHKEIDINFSYYLKKLNEVLDPFGYYIIPNMMPVPPSYRIFSFGSATYVYYSMYKTSDYSRLLVANAVHL